MLTLKKPLEHALVAFHRRFVRPRPRLILVVSALIVACSALALAGLRVNPTLAPTLPRGEPWNTLRAVERDVPPAPSVVVSLPVKDPFSDDGFRRMRALTQALLLHRDLWTVQSPATSDDLQVNGDMIDRVPLAPDPSTAKERISRSPLLKALCLSPALDAWTITLVLARGGDPGAWLPALDGIRRGFPEVRCAGTPYLEALVREKLLRDLFLLLPACAAALLVLYVLLLRSARQAFVLWGASLVPTVICCALFPLTGTPLRVYTILAPFLTMALSTSYSMHLLYGMRSFGGAPEKALASRGPIVILDAGAAALGFLTLLFSPLMELRSLGIFVVGGVMISLAVAFVPFMAVLEITAGWMKTYPVARSLPRARAGAWAGARAPGAGRPRALALGAAVLVSVAVVAGLGLPRLSVGNRLRDQFPPWSRESREIRWMENTYGGLEEIVLEVDSGKELGLADPQLYQRVASFEESAAGLAAVSRVVSYADLVKEVESRLGASTSAAPGEAAIAEDMELAASLTAGGLGRVLFDPQGRRARISIFLAPSSSRPPTLETVPVLSGLLDSGGLGGHYRWGGAPVEQAWLDVSFAREQAVSCAILLAVYALLLAFVFDSPWHGLLALLPAVSGLVVALGFLGAMGWSLNQANVLSLVAVAGLSIDGAIMCLMIESNPATRRAIRDAFILVAGAIVSLSPSSFYQIFQAVAAAVLGLAAATLTVLFVVDPSRSPRAAGKEERVAS